MALGTQNKGDISAFVCLLLALTTAIDANEEDINGYDSDLFLHYTYEVEEGFLMQERIIANITLDKDNYTEYFLFDEPYFEKPNNRKMKPQPRHFNVTFINVTSSENVTTPMPKTHKSERSVRSLENEGSGLYNDSSAVVLVGRNYTKGVHTTGTRLAVFTTASAADTHNVTGGMTGYLSAGITPEYATTDSTVTVRPNRSTVTTTSLPSLNNATTTQVIAQLKQIYDLDREKMDTHYLTISSYLGGYMADLPIIIEIKVTDKNDNQPVFVKESLSSEITRNVKAGQVVAEIKAIDADIGKNADLRYSILDFTERINNASSSPDMPTFAIHGKLGLVFLMNSLEEFTIPSEIKFSVVVKDRGDENVANRATATATVRIVDPDSVPPADKQPISGVIVAVSLVAVVLVLGVSTFVMFRCKKTRRQQDSQLAFMLDDENLITA